MLNAKELNNYVIEVGETKIKKSNSKTFVGAVLAGIFVSFGALIYFKLMSNSTNYVLSITLAGITFSIGIILVLVTGADLFTGNILISQGLYKNKYGMSKVLKNWAIVWLGNLVGVLVMAGLVHLAHSLDNTAYEYIHHFVADIKLEKDIPTLLASGILCNIIVCLTILMAYTGKTTTDKILASIIGITVFVIGGFEHVVANMFYYAMYILEFGLSDITVSSILIALAVVTLGNILGGMIVTGLYHFYHKEK